MNNSNKNNKTTTTETLTQNLWTDVYSSANIEAKVFVIFQCHIPIVNFLQNKFGFSLSHHVCLAQFFSIFLPQLFLWRRFSRHIQYNHRQHNRMKHIIHLIDSKADFNSIPINARALGFIIIICMLQPYRRFKSKPIKLLLLLLLFVVRRFLFLINQCIGRLISIASFLFPFSLSLPQSHFT